MENLAEKAGLRYVNDNDPGYHRKPWGRGFTYINEKGEHITDEKERQRLEALAIPPAWTDIWICPSPDGHIQATGRDEKERKQYIYHTAWEVARNEVKFSHLLTFGEALPRLRVKVAGDLRKHKLSHEAVTALIVRLLDTTYLRIGNSSYAESNGSYGLTTLQNEHTEIEGTAVIFSFPGKGGKQQEVTIRDRRLAQLVQRCHDLPGQHLFQYVGEDGVFRSISSTDVNDYLREHTGEDFTAKIFRTWGATVAAAELLADLDLPESEQEAKKNAVAAVKCAAQLLGNTPAICRDYYLHPAVFEFYESGELARAFQDIQSGKVKNEEGLNEIETAVLRLLRSREQA
jgi:DNA topoisomerase-1